MNILATLRSPKIGGMAAFDIIATAVASYILANRVNYLVDFNIYYLTVFIFIVLIAMGVILHMVTKTPTMLNHYLGINTLNEVELARASR